MEFVNGKDDIPDMKWKIKAMFQTTSQKSWELGESGFPAKQFLGKSWIQPFISAWRTRQSEQPGEICEILELNEHWNGKFIKPNEGFSWIFPCHVWLLEVSVISDHFDFKNNMVDRVTEWPIPSNPNFQWRDEHPQSEVLVAFNPWSSHVCFSNVFFHIFFFRASKCWPRLGNYLPLEYTSLPSGNLT